MLALALSGCASIDDKVQQCRAEGGLPEIVETIVPRTVCDCDAPGTTVKCTPGSTVVLTDGRSCGSQVTRRVQCLPKPSGDLPTTNREGKTLWEIIREDP